MRPAADVMLALSDVRLAVRPSFAFGDGCVKADRVTRASYLLGERERSHLREKCMSGESRNELAHVGEKMP